MSIEIPDIVKVWKIGGSTGNVVSNNSYRDNQGYNLFCASNNKYLTWKRMLLGINLDYTTDPNIKKVHFKLPDGQEREVLSGETVALGIGGGEAYLKYEHRNVGINLEWSSRPSFEWQLHSGSDGSPVALGAMLAIANLRVEPKPDFLVFLDRAAGAADVGWTSSPPFWNDLANTPRDVLDAVREFLGEDNR